MTTDPPAMSLSSKKISPDIPSRPLSSSETLCSSHSPSPPTFSFYLDWTIRLLSLIAALLFGIWAPLAYTATLVANRDADVFQTTLSQRLDELASMQRTVHERLRELEMLKVWEFCAGAGADVVACRSLMNGKGNETVEKLGTVVGNAFASPTPTMPTGIVLPTGSKSPVPSSSDMGTVSSKSSGGVVSRATTGPATTIPTVSASATFSMPVGVGDPGQNRSMDMRGLGAAAGVIGFVALLAVMCMRARSSAYRTYHRV